MIAKSVLEEFGARIDVAGNGKEAVELFNARAYKIILMDLNMPVMDGYEATRLIQEKNTNIPVIALTATTEDEVLSKSGVSKFVAVVQKPFNPDVLCRTILRYTGQM